MLHSNVMAAEMPEYVLVEKLPDGTKRVILSKNASAVENKDGKSWVFDQADFCLEPDREETAEDIAPLLTTGGSMPPPTARMMPRRRWSSGWKAWRLLCWP